jgi:regulator of sirC expression with transglutaminase-like and TPR domain
MVRDIIDRPTIHLDYLQTKLALDQIVDPAMGLESITSGISRLAAFATEMAGPGADDARKLAAVRTVIYRAGPWNENRPFAYDLADPYGQNLRNKLLSTYLSTRRGNCVSMPILFLILADRLGVNVALSTAPLHVFLKFTDTAGKVTNLETTSGALPARDQWYREKLPMTDQAVANGLYLRTLSRKESVALMATTVMEHLMDQGRYQDAIDVADVILAHSPRDAETMVKRGSAFARLLDEEFYMLYPTADLVRLIFMTAIGSWSAPTGRRSPKPRHWAGPRQKSRRLPGRRLALNSPPGVRVASHDWFRRYRFRWPVRNPLIR